VTIIFAISGFLLAVSKISALLACYVA
jgi:hypothetical protein